MFYFKQSFLRTVIFVAWCKENYAFGSDVLQYIFSCALWVSVILTLLTYDYDYWTYRGIFSPPVWPVVGHIWKMATFREHSGLFFKRMYDMYKHKRCIGIHQFYRRTVVVMDPELIRRMCVPDFQHFTDRGFSFDRDLDPLAESVLYLRGNEWKALRSKISPIFSPIKLKGMLPLVDNTAIEFVTRVKKLLNEDENNNERNDIKDDGKVVSCGEMFGGYTADAIVPCAFGVKSHVMENPEDPFAVALRAYYVFTLRNVLEKSLHYFWPAFAIFMKIRIIPKKTHDFFYNIVTNVIRERQNGVHDKRGDFIDMMMALQNDERNHNVSDKDDVRITDMIISANAFIIFLGGFETTSSTLSFMFLELSEHPEVQGKMRAEIQEVLGKHGGKITYETLQDLTYMEMVIQETLRLYPPFPAIQRQCRRRYTLPQIDRHTDDVVVEPDTLVIFPTLGLHRDEQYFENASSFIPERWAEGKPPPPPGVYMPFGEGPRYCIGKRFAIIQMKCCLVKLLQHVKISPAPGRQDKSDSESCILSDLCVRSDSELGAQSKSCVRSDSELGAQSKSCVRSDSASSTQSKPKCESSTQCQSCVISNTETCTQFDSYSYRSDPKSSKSSRREPFAADVRCPMTLHPADSRVTLSLL